MVRRPGGSRGSRYGERQYIGSEIRRQRLERSWTLDDLAGSAGLSPSHLSRIERRLARLSFSRLAAIAEALGVSLEHFVALEAEIDDLNWRLREQFGAAGVAERQVEEILTMTVPAHRALSQALSG